MTKEEVRTFLFLFRRAKIPRIQTPLPPSRIKRKNVLFRADSLLSVTIISLLDKARACVLCCCEVMLGIY